MAETFALSKGTEAGLRIRAAIVDAMGKLQLSNWEETAAMNMGHVWYTDCDSLYEHLISANFKAVDNKRLSIDLTALKQIIWAHNDESNEYVNSDSGDYPRWIDTSVMLVDPLTKTMNPNVLEKTMTTGIWDLKPTSESIWIKEKNRRARRKTKEDRNREQVEEWDTTEPNWWIHGNDDFPPMEPPDEDELAFMMGCA